MDVKKVDIDSIKPYENNPRKNNAAVKKVAESLKEYGWQQPIVVDKNSVIVVGHTRYKAAKRLKMKKVPVHVAVDLTDKQIKAYRLADNRTAQEANWNDDLLKFEFEGLKNLEFDLELTGFDGFEIDKILNLNADESTGDVDCNIDKLAEQSKGKIITKFGDIWELGNHRLMCGDSTTEDVATLVGDNSINLVVTDPPYNVAYNGKRNEREIIANDMISNDDFILLLKHALENCKNVMAKDASIYVWHSSTFQFILQKSLEELGFEIRNQIVWVKNHFTISYGRYNQQHELLFYAHFKNESDKWHGDAAQSTTWQFDRLVSSKLHPTMKPIGLIQKSINNSSKAGDNVLDVFGGSGSTLIACEKTDRKCFMLEVDPQYVDVIIQRWQEFTGKLAFLSKNGKTFKQLRSKQNE